MPLWKVYHPAGAYTAQDKKDLSERITGMYATRTYSQVLCGLHF